jgi:hypothetical protein
MPMFDALSTSGGGWRELMFAWDSRLGRSQRVSALDARQCAKRVTKRSFYMSVLEVDDGRDQQWPITSEWPQPVGNVRAGLTLSTSP